ncbi:MAG: lysozyme inhibitor LprI family protein [Lachnospiraceae bacterium]
MACPYYSFKDDLHFGGEYYCTKCQDYTNDDLYYAYCKNYSYDECPLYRGQVNSVEGAKRYRAGSSGSSSLSGSASNSGGTDSYSQNTYSGGGSRRGDSIPTPSVSTGGGWLDTFVGFCVIVAIIAVVSLLLTVFVRPFGIWYLILVSKPQILAVVATIGIMAFTVWQKWNNKILIFLEIFGVSFLSMCISWYAQGGGSLELNRLMGYWILFTIPNFLIVCVIRYFMGKDSEISPNMKTIFIALCIAYIIGLIIGIATPFGKEILMDSNKFIVLKRSTQYNNNQNGNSGNYSGGNNNISGDNDIDTNNIVGDTDVNDYDNNSYSGYDGNEYDDSGYGSYDYYNGDKNNSDSADTGTGSWDNSATYQSELDMIRNEYLLSPDEEDQVRFYYEWSDGLLNDLYQDIKSNLPSSDFEILKEDEKEWIAQKESEAEAAGNNSSNYNLAYQLSITESMIDRCQYLIDNYQGYYSNTITSNLP